MSEPPGSMLWMLALLPTEACTPEEGDELCTPWRTHAPPAMRQDESVEEGGRWIGEQVGGTHWQIDWKIRSTTVLLRMTASRPSSRSCADLVELRRLVDGVAAEAQQHAKYRPPWAVAICYHGVLPTGTTAQAAQDCLAQLDLEPGALLPCDETLYGFLWQSAARADGASVWRHTLVLLTPEERVSATRRSFLDPFEQGLARIELYLALCGRLRHEYEMCDPEQADCSMSEVLEQCRQELERQAHAKEVHELVGRPLRQAQPPLEALAESQMEYLTQRERAEVQLHDLEVNRRNLVYHLQWARLATGDAASAAGSAGARSYAIQVQHLEQAAEQIRADLALGRATLDCASASLDILRAAEANQLQRYSFLFAAAAMLLAAVTIFNSFLDIWNLSTQGTALNMPAPQWRVLPALVAAISGPVAAYDLVNGRTRRAIGWAALLALAAAAAVVLTVV
jgi:hypothetical protein